jgi:lysophospholipase L1-like esterase
MGHIIYNSAVKQIHVINAGWGGATSNDLVAATNNWGTVGSIAFWTPDLVIINIGINDLNQATPTAQATFNANVQQIINAAKAVNADVILMVPTPIGTANGLANQATFQTYIHALATTNSLNVIDMLATWGSFATANANGWMNTDLIHPKAIGYAQVANTVFGAIYH